VILVILSAQPTPNVHTRIKRTAFEHMGITDLFGCGLLKTDSVSVLSDCP
jgi:hypothetical protein